MEVYLVGGAVRDHLLGREVMDRDFVVVGSTPKEMISKGFIQVGKNFPVFLHPTTKEEYALARKEVKAGKGHQSFDFKFGPEITLLEDLFRRDFTINAMAMNIETNNLIDPFNGHEDLKKKNLKHVSKHFIEDPLRVLRAARFLSVLDGFTLDPSTLIMIKKLVQDDELLHMSQERILNEFKKSYHSGRPWDYLRLLKEWKALEKVTPLIETTYNYQIEKICLFEIISFILKKFKRSNLSFDLAYSLIIFCILLSVANPNKKATGSVKLKIDNFFKYDQDLVLLLLQEISPTLKLSKDSSVFLKDLINHLPVFLFFNKDRDIGLDFLNTFLQLRIFETKRVHHVLEFYLSLCLSLKKENSYELFNQQINSLISRRKDFTTNSAGKDIKDELNDFLLEDLKNLR